MSVSVQLQQSSWLTFVSKTVSQLWIALGMVTGFVTSLMLLQLCPVSFLTFPLFWPFVQLTHALSGLSFISITVATVTAAPGIVSLFFVAASTVLATVLSVILSKVILGLPKTRQSNLNATVTQELDDEEITNPEHLNSGHLDIMTDTYAANKEVGVSLTDTASQYRKQLHIDEIAMLLKGELTLEEIPTLEQIQQSLNKIILHNEMLMSRDANNLSTSAASKRRVKKIVAVLLSFGVANRLFSNSHNEQAKVTNIQEQVKRWVQLLMQSYGDEIFNLLLEFKHDAAAIQVLSYHLTPEQREKLLQHMIFSKDSASSLSSYLVDLECLARQLGLSDKDIRCTMRTKLMQLIKSEDDDILSRLITAHVNLLKDCLTLEQKEGLLQRTYEPCELNRFKILVKGLGFDFEQLKNAVQRLVTTKGIEILSKFSNIVDIAIVGDCLTREQLEVLLQTVYGENSKDLKRFKNLVSHLNISLVNAIHSIPNFLVRFNVDLSDYEQQELLRDTMGDKFISSALGKGQIANNVNYLRDYFSNLSKKEKLQSAFDPKDLSLFEKCAEHLGLNLVEAIKLTPRCLKAYIRGYKECCENVVGKNTNVMGQNTKVYKFFEFKLSYDDSESLISRSNKIGVNPLVTDSDASLGGQGYQGEVVSTLSKTSPLPKIEWEDFVPRRSSRSRSQSLVDSAQLYAQVGYIGKTSMERSSFDQSGVTGSGSSPRYVSVC